MGLSRRNSELLSSNKQTVTLLRSVSSVEGKSNSDDYVQKNITDASANVQLFISMLVSGYISSHVLIQVQHDCVLWHVLSLLYDH